MTETFSIVCVGCNRKRYLYTKNYRTAVVPKYCSVCEMKRKHKQVEKDVLAGLKLGDAIYEPLRQGNVMTLMCATCATTFKARWTGSGTYDRSKHSAYCAECRKRKTFGYIGVDPGSPVCLALLTKDGKWVGHATDDAVSGPAKSGVLNDPEKVSAIVRAWVDKLDYPVKMVIENVAPRTGEGITSACKFAGSIWLMRGIAASMGIPVLRVTPQRWMDHYGLTAKTRVKRDKKDSLIVARKLFPNRADFIKLAKTHDLAEAALLARYAADIE